MSVRVNVQREAGSESCGFESKKQGRVRARPITVDVRHTLLGVAEEPDMRGTYTGRQLSPSVGDTCVCQTLYANISRAVRQKHPLQ